MASKPLAGRESSTVPGSLCATPGENDFPAFPSIEDVEKRTQPSQIRNKANAANQAAKAHAPQDVDEGDACSLIVPPGKE